MNGFCVVYAKCQRFTRNFKSNQTPEYGNKSGKCMCECLLLYSSAESGVTFGQSRSKNHDRNLRRQHTAHVCDFIGQPFHFPIALFHSLGTLFLFSIFFSKLQLNTQTLRYQENKNQNRNDWIYRKKTKNKNKQNSCGMFRYPICTDTINKKKINWTKLVSFRFSGYRDRVHKVAWTKQYTILCSWSFSGELFCL